VGESLHGSADGLDGQEMDACLEAGLVCGRARIEEYA
jgi:hypothetical protein